MMLVLAIADGNIGPKRSQFVFRLEQGPSAQPAWPQIASPGRSQAVWVRLLISQLQRLIRSFIPRVIRSCRSGM